MDDILDQVIPLKDPGFNNSSNASDKEETSNSKLGSFSHDLPEDLNQLCSPWEMEKKGNFDFDNGNVFPGKIDGTKEKSSQLKSNFHPMEVDQCDINTKNGYGKLTRLKKNSDKENIASILERKPYPSQDNASQFILNKKRQTVVSPSSFSVASSKKLRLDGRKSSPIISPESPILQLHNFSEQLSISSPSPKHSPDLFESPQSPKFFSSSLPSALAPLSCPEADLVFDDDRMNAGSSTSRMISNNNEICVDSNKKVSKLELELENKPSYSCNENGNENGWNYAVFDLEAEEKSAPSWPLEESSSIKEIFKNTSSDCDYSKLHHPSNSVVTNKKGTKSNSKSKKSGCCGSSNVVHGIIYLSDSDDEGGHKSASDIVSLKGKPNVCENKSHRKKRYWNAPPKHKDIEMDSSSSRNDVAAHSFSDAEIEILPMLGESSKKGFKKPFSGERFRNSHTKHHKNVDVHCASKEKKHSCLSDSESDSLNTSFRQVTGQLQKSPRCQLFPRHSPVLPRVRESSLRNAGCSSHKSSSSSIVDQELEHLPSREMAMYVGPLTGRSKSKNHSKKTSHPKTHNPPSDVTVLNNASSDDKKDDNVPHNPKNGANNIPYRSSDCVNHSSPQLHLPPHHRHHHHHRHHRSHNRRGTHQEISRNRDAFRTRLRLDPIIFDSESNEDESSSEPPINSQDLTNLEHGEVLNCDNNTHNSIAASPDPVQQLQQLESDEMLARMLQAQFDAELDLPDFQRSSRRSHHRPPMPLPTGRRPTGRALRPHGSPFITPSMAPNFELNPATHHPLGFHNWEPSSSDESDLDFLLPSVIMDSPLVEFIYGDMDWRDNGIHFMRLDRPRVARGRSTRTFTRRNRALPSFMVGNDGNDYEALWELAEQIGEVTKRGLSRREINRLPTRIHSNPPEGFPASQCHICMCDYEEGDRLRILPCFHEFHAPCIDRWIKDNATCPVCRARVNTERTAST